MAGKQRGQHRHNALSAAFVKNAKGPGFFADGNGLYLKVDPTGARRWVQRLQIDGRRRDIAIGPVSVVSLVEARDAATDNKRMVRNGGDPTSKRKEVAPTFETAVGIVHNIHKPTWRSDKHSAQFLSTLETYAFPFIAKKSVAEIDSADVLAVLQPIWLAKPETATRVKQRISLVLKWSIAKGWRTDNPTLSISEALPRQDRTQRTNRKALPYSEVSSCIKAVWESNANQISKMALECLVLTASRSAEIRMAHVNELNLGAAIWEIPASRMKMKRPHIIPLVPRVVELFESALKIHDGSGLIFPSARFGRPMSDATLLKLVRSKGFDCHIHGFRASFRTWAEEQSSAPHAVAEAALAHSKGDETTKAYARSGLFDRRRELMTEWADYLASNDHKGVLK